MDNRKLAGMLTSVLVLLVLISGGAVQAATQQSDAVWHEKGKHEQKTDMQPLLDLFKMTKEELKQELRAGKSLADIARAKGVPTDKVIAVLIKQREQRLTDEVKAGRLTQAQADELRKRLPELMQKRLEYRHTDKMHHKRVMLWKNAELQKLLKLDEQALRAEWKSGKSLAEIAQEKGVSREELSRLIAKHHNEILQKAVEEGRLSKEKAEEMKARTDEFVKHVIDKKRQQPTHVREGEEHKHQQHD
ncbi:MAG: hypothetical protein ACM32O_01845 [Clostridia bacterium]